MTMTTAAQDDHDDLETQSERAYWADELRAAFGAQHSFMARKAKKYERVFVEHVITGFINGVWALLDDLDESDQPDDFHDSDTGMTDDRNSD